MRAAVGWVVSGILVLGSAGCSSEDKTFGVATAGPTKTTAPESTPAPVPTPTAQATAAKPKIPVCELFSAADVTGVLGPEVTEVAKTSEGPYTVCTWRAKKAAETP